MKGYKVRFELDESNWWLVTIPALPGCHTQSRTIEQGKAYIREALALCTTDEIGEKAPLTFEIILPDGARGAVEEAQAKRKAAEDTAEASAKASRAAAKRLARVGLSNRDIGTLLGVTRQRAHQMKG